MMSPIDSSLETVSLKPATSYTSTSLTGAVKLRLGKHPPQSIPQFFRDCCERYPDKRALVYETDKKVWQTVTYAEYWRHVEQTALLLLNVGLQSHSSVGILSFNCPEWFYTQLGALRAGAIVAGIYPTSSPEAVYHVLNTAEATVCVVDDAAQMAKLRQIKSRLPRLSAVIQLHGPFDEFVGTEPGYYRWEDLMQREYDAQLKEELERREREVRPNECAVLIFTSGTVGMPKGVMLSHDSVIADAQGLATTLTGFVNGAEVAVTYLPLNHIAGQMFDIFLNIQNAGCVYFADRNALKGTLTRTFIKSKPTRIFGVPRVFEKMREKLELVEAQSSVFSKFLLQWAREVVLQNQLQASEGKPPSSIKYWLASKIIRQVKIALGLECCRYFLVGGAPVTEELKRYFMSLDMPITEVYGLSESSGAATLGVDYKNFKAVGRAVDGVDLKIANPDSSGMGEVCIWGRTILMGYLNEPEKTREALSEDGWLRTGDVGYLDNEGNLYITGRSKELIITAGGENIPPVYIESYVKKELKGISNAVVVGDGRKYLTILLTIKTEVCGETGKPTNKLQPDAIEWMKSLGLKYTLLSEVLNIPEDLTDYNAASVEVKPNEKVIQSIEEGLQRANKNAISNAQKVQKFALLPHDFSVATQELGPTLKVRRNIVLQKYAPVIENLYH